MKESPRLTPSWDLLNESTRLIGSHVISLFWLVIIPSVLSGLGGYQLEKALRQLAGNSAPTLNDYANVFQSDGAQLGVMLSLVATFWMLLTIPAVLTLSVQGVRGAGDELIGFIRSGFKYTWRLYGTLMLLSIAVMLGILLFVVPGLIILRRYIMAPYYLVERNVGIMEAFKLSAQQTRAERKSVWGVMGVIFVILLATSFVNGFGLIGVLLGIIMNLLYFFLVPLRQKEISDIAHYEDSSRINTTKPTAKKR